MWPHLCPLSRVAPAAPMCLRCMAQGSKGYPLTSLTSACRISARLRALPKVNALGRAFDVTDIPFGGWIFEAHHTFLRWSVF